MKAFVIGIAAIFAANWATLGLPQFGATASGKRRKRILASLNFKNGQFQNLSPTPDLSPGTSYWDLLFESVKKHPNTAPKSPIPSVNTNLKSLDLSKNQLVWFGHSSYLLVLDGKTILVDPVFSGNASPFSFGVKAFDGANNFGSDDMPAIDILLLTHDHYDHIDYKTILSLKPKVKHIITSLGVGAHLEAWGYAENLINELDWHESLTIEGLQFTALPARHFSGRTFKRKVTLWSSFAIKASNQSLFIGGDSGYDSHFEQIGAKHGPFSLALLDGAQYHQHWHMIHMNPEQSVQASIDLKAQKVIPVHWGKFSLAFHPWYEPIERFVAEAERKNVTYLTQKIGMPITWENPQTNNTWWKAII